MKKVLLILVLLFLIPLISCNETRLRFYLLYDTAVQKGNYKLTFTSIDETTMKFELIDIPKDISKLGRNTETIRVEIRDTSGRQYPYKLFLDGVETCVRDMTKFNCSIEVVLDKEEMELFILNIKEYQSSIVVLGNHFIPLDEQTWRNS